MVRVSPQPLNLNRATFASKLLQQFRDFLIAEEGSGAGGTYGPALCVPRCSLLPRSPFSLSDPSPRRPRPTKGNQAESSRLLTFTSPGQFSSCTRNPAITTETSYDGHGATCRDSTLPRAQTVFDHCFEVQENGKTTREIDMFTRLG